MLFCLEEHMHYRVEKATLHSRKVYLAQSQDLLYRVTRSKIARLL